MFGTTSRIVYYNGNEYLAKADKWHRTVIVIQGIKRTATYSLEMPMKVLYSNCEVWI